MLAGDIKDQFGAAVRKQRKRLGISQEELAGRAGLHRTYIADIERGARNISLASIEKLAQALGTSIAAMFPGPHSDHGGSGDRVNILLVEDEADDVELTLRAFANARLANCVHVVHDGPEALDYLFRTGRHAKRKLESVPQVVLLDLNLPRMNGLEVLKKLKADDRTKHIPVIVLTVSERSRDIELSKKLGAAAYIIKPVDFTRFCDVTPKLSLCWALLKNGSLCEVRA
jgi:CheY-like chemotaxis protein/DNA-binding XRE family transcriptional regulator